MAGRRWMPAHRRDHSPPDTGPVSNDHRRIESRLSEARATVPRPARRAGLHAGAEAAIPGGAASCLSGSPREARLTPAALDVLALVAYRQPIAKAEIDSQRGADSRAPRDNSCASAWSRSKHAGRRAKRCRLRHHAAFPGVVRPAQPGRFAAHRRFAAAVKHSRGSQSLTPGYWPPPLQGYRQCSPEATGYAIGRPVKTRGSRSLTPGYWPPPLRGYRRCSPEGATR